MNQQDAPLVVVEQRLDRAMSIIPYVLLLLSTALSLIASAQSWHDRVVTLGLALLAGLWMWLMSSVRPPGPVYVTGLIAMIAILAFRDPWFAGFFGFAGYLQSWHCLRGGWRIVGVAATAIVTLTPLLVTVIPPTPSGILVYGLVLAAIVVLVALFSFFGDHTPRHSRHPTRQIARPL